MKILIVAYFISAFACFESAITVYRLNRHAKVNRFYTALAASFSFYSIFMIQLFLSSDQSICWYWSKALAFMICLSSVLSFRFILELTGITLIKNKVFLAGLYAAAAVIVLPALTFSPVISGFIMMPWGWDIVMKISGWAVFYHSYLTLQNLASLSIAIYWRYKAETFREKKQAGIIIFALLIWATGLLHILFPPVYPNMLRQMFNHLFNVFCFIVLMAWVRYAIIKYKLMTISPIHPASELFNGMSEALFVINTGGDIIFMNDNAAAFARRPGKSGHANNIFNIFSSGGLLKKEIDDIIFGRQAKLPVVTTAGKQTADEVYEISIHGIKNEIRELIGLMVIVRAAGGAAELQEIYSLSKREMEVFILLSSGLSANEIAKECDITLQTAKSHIHSIYQKTDLRNRVELSNLINRYI